MTGISGVMDNEDLRLKAAVEAARDAWGAFSAAWQDVLDILRAADDERLNFEYERLDAYAVGTGRDEGMGQSMEGYFDEVARVATGREKDEG